MAFRAPVLGVLVLLALAGVPRDAAATVVVPADFTEMVGESHIIVHGHVADVRSYTTADRQSIESVVTITVTQSLKGDAGRTVVFRVPNGQVGRYRRVTVGAPEFRSGDEVVVFLKGRPPVVPMPYGLHQGVYRVQRGAQSRTLVTPAPVLGSHAETAHLVRGDARRGTTLEAFVGQVRAIAGTAGPPGRTALPRAPGATTARPRPERQP